MAKEEIFLTFSDKPRAILESMDNLTNQQKRLDNIYKKRKRFPLLLFLAGFPFIGLDFLLFLLGYPNLVFCWILPVCWLAALTTRIALRRMHSLELPPRYVQIRQVIHTLRDDVHPKGRFFGQIDLTGTRKPEKVARETEDALGRTTQHFRDEWLSIKSKLYDGNMLRLSAVQREKIRKGYWKRSSFSGKTKWKPEKYKGIRHDLKVQISINPEVYDQHSIPPLPLGTTFGVYRLSQVNNEGGILKVLASSMAKDVSANDILAVLQGTYGLLKRKGAI